MGGVLDRRAQFALAGDTDSDFVTGLARENRRLRTELNMREAELRAERSKSAVASERERNRIERNLHDGAQQQLLSLAVAMRTAAARATDDPQSISSVLDGVADDLVELMRDLRDLSMGSRPAVLVEGGLIAAVSLLSGRCSVPVEVVGVPSERLPEGVEGAAYFVIAESLTNIDKHAGATRAAVCLSMRGQRLAIEVRDDGVGGVGGASALRGEGSGLRGLRERADALGGTLDIVEVLGGGTLVRAVLPISPER